LKLFDFNVAEKINQKDLKRFSNFGRNDVNGVIFAIHELLTFDQLYRSGGWLEEDVSQVENLTEWPVRRALEEGTDVVTCRNFLARWAADRRTKRTIHDHSEATEPLEWPTLPEPKPCEHLTGFREDGQPNMRFDVRFQSRYLALQDGRQVVSWERPSQNVLHQWKARRENAVAGRLGLEEA
jgi:hypothetical protein